jgi:predicted AlkP superfamily pyrophosphatase or phosphodiesterase
MSTTDRRVIVFGADGLRPDLIDADLMPNLVKLAADGVLFTDHHAAYPSHTRVNSSTFSTGTTPGRHGIVANTMLVPDATPDHIIDTGNYEHLDALRSHDARGTQMVDSLSDVLDRNGFRMAVAGTGSSGSNVLWSYGNRGRLVNPNHAFGIADLYDLREKLGPVPAKTIPDTEQARYATRAVTDLFLHDETIKVITLWLAEPDSSLHYRGLGSPESKQAMRVVDECLGMLLDDLDSRGIRDQVDVLFLSDHGHSTVQSHNTLREYLIAARKDLGDHLPQLATASDFIYTLPGTAEPTVEQLAPLVEWLQAQPWADVVLGGLEGTETLPGVLKLADLWNGQINDRRPLLAVSPTWSDEINEFGVPGRVSALTTQTALKSSHGSLSPYEMHATFIAKGPSFRERLVSDLPTGATDIMPTILSILGLEAPGVLDGRVVHEALSGSGGPVAEREDSLLEATAPTSANRSVRIHRVGNTTYVHGSAQGGTYAVASNAAETVGNAVAVRG